MSFGRNTCVEQAVSRDAKMLDRTNTGPWRLAFPHECVGARGWPSLSF